MTAKNLQFCGQKQFTFSASPELAAKAVYSLRIDAAMCRWDCISRLTACGLEIDPDLIDLYFDALYTILIFRRLRLVSGCPLPLDIHRFIFYISRSPRVYLN